MSEPKKAEPVKTAAERVALYLELYPYPSVGSEIVYDQRFKTEKWPRTAYPLLAKDVQQVIKDLAAAEEMNTLQRTDMEELQAKIEDMKEEQDQYEENVVGDANERAINDARRIAELEGLLKASEEMVFSLRLNGAGHHFQYGHQEHDGTKYVDYCGLCKRDKGHPAHFAQGARYLDSREVEAAAEAAQERLCNILVDGMKLNHRTALNTARELLQGLPGIRDYQAVPGRPEVQG